jgi:hypothetical protein
VDAMTKREWVWAQRDMLSLMLITLVALAAFLWGRINSGWIALAVGSAGAILTLAGIMLVVIAAHLRHLDDKGQVQLQAYWEGLRAQQMPQIEIVEGEIVDDWEIFAWHVWKQDDGLFSVVPYTKDGENLWSRAAMRNISPGDTTFAWDLAKKKNRELQAGPS